MKHQETPAPASVPALPAGTPPRRPPAVASHNWIDTRVLIGQPYEDEQIASTITLIREHDIEAFLDVGANIGLYSVFVGLATPVDIHAFEPVSRN